MASDTNSNGVLTRKEREELVLDLYFNQNKTYPEIAKIAKISPRDIKLSFLHYPEIISITILSLASLRKS